jgi:hypothetical protein
LAAGLVAASQVPTASAVKTSERRVGSRHFIAFLKFHDELASHFRNQTVKLRQNEGEPVYRGAFDIWTGRIVRWCNRSTESKRPRLCGSQ